MDNRRPFKLISMLWPVGFVLWTIPIIVLLRDKDLGLHLWFIMPFAALSMCIICGICAALAGGFHENSCSQYIIEFVTRAKYLLLPTVVGTSLVGILSFLSITWFGSYIAIFLTLVSIILMILFVFTTTIGCVGKLGLIGAFHTAVRFIINPTAIGIVLGPIICGILFRWFVRTVTGGLLAPATVEDISLTGIALSDALFSALLVLFVWSRLVPSEKWGMIGLGTRCIIMPARTIFSALLGAVIYRFMFELIPGAFISWGSFLSAYGITHVINMPFSVGSLIIAIVGIGIISALCSGNLLCTVIAVIASRILFVASVSVSGISMGQNNTCLSILIGKVAIMSPLHYIVGLIVYAALSIFLLNGIYKIRKLSMLRHN